MKTLEAIIKTWQNGVRLPLPGASRAFTELLSAFNRKLGEIRAVSVCAAWPIVDRSQ
jgi:hypothetical protein